MKKILFAILIALSLISCGNKALTDDCGCFVDYEEALDYAGKKNLPLLLVFSSEGDDGTSSILVNQVLKASSDKLSSKYSILHADFSQNAHKKTLAPDGASEQEQQLANTYTNIMQQNYSLAILLGVSQTPAAFLCTKEGYIVTALQEEDFLDKSNFIGKLEDCNSELERFNKLVAPTKKGSALDKVEAIDTLFIATPQSYRSFLLPLITKAIELDKNNKTGLIGKLILAKAESEAMTLYSQGEIDEALKKYLEAANNEYLRPEEKQECCLSCYSKRFYRLRRNY